MARRDPLKPRPFQSAAARRGIFATNPTYAHHVANTVGAKIGGGFSKAQIKSNPALEYHGKKATDPSQ